MMQLKRCCISPDLVDITQHNDELSVTMPPLSPSFPDQSSRVAALLVPAALEVPAAVAPHLRSKPRQVVRRLKVVWVWLHQARDVLLCSNGQKVLQRFFSRRLDCPRQPMRRRIGSKLGPSQQNRVVTDHSQSTCAFRSDTESCEGGLARSSVRAEAIPDKDNHRVADTGQRAELRWPD